DAAIYKVGFKKQRHLDLFDPKDIEQINVLQFLNCYETVFFNQEAREDYLRSLFTKSQRFNRANISRTDLSYIFKEGDDTAKILKSGKKNFIIAGTTDCEINLNVTSI